MNLLRFILSYILESSTLMLAAFVSYDIAALFRNKRFISTKMPHRNALVYHIFGIIKTHVFFSFSLHVTLFSPNEYIVFVDIVQDNN